MLSASQSFTPDARELAFARGFVGKQLALWGLEALDDDIALLVSELFTNALQHGSGPITLDLNVEGRGIYVRVADRGGGRPAIRPLDLSGGEPGGWGLRMVDQLSDQWGTRVEDGTTVVWLRKALPPSSSPHR